MVLVPQIEAVYPNLPNSRWIALRLLDGDERITEAFRSGELGDLTAGLDEEVHLQSVEGVKA